MSLLSCESIRYECVGVNTTTRDGLERYTKTKTNCRNKTGEDRGLLMIDTMKGKVNPAVFTGRGRIFHIAKEIISSLSPTATSCSLTASRCACVYVYIYIYEEKLNAFTLSLGLYWMTYSIWPFGPSSMSVAPLFPENPVKMVVPTGVNCKTRGRYSLKP